MRPVDLTSKPPAGYPQADILAGQINLKAAPPRDTDGDPYFSPVNPYVLSDAATDYSKLIDTWLTNDLAWTIVNEDQVRVLDTANQVENLTLNSQYNALQRALGNLNDYALSRKHLIDEIGPYCSYCETPLVCRLAIEHTLPKSWFPTYRFAWENFLLCCPTCNSVKNDTPNQQIDKKYIDTSEAVVQIGKLYAWPNTYWKEYQKTFAPILPYKMRIYELNKRTNSWKKEITSSKLEALLPSMKINLAGISGNAFRIFKATARSPEHTSDETAYGAKAIPAHDGSDKGATAQRMIDLVQLNRTQKQNTTSSSDSRVANRTMTYFRALTMKNAVSEILDMPGNVKPLAGALTDVIYQTAGRCGFWSVWREALKDMYGAEEALQEVFPGTASVEWTT